VEQKVEIKGEAKISTELGEGCEGGNGSQWISSRHRKMVSIWYCSILRPLIMLKDRLVISLLEKNWKYIWIVENNLYICNVKQEYNDY